MVKYIPQIIAGAFAVLGVMSPEFRTVLVANPELSSAVTAALLSVFHLISSPLKK